MPAQTLYVGSLPQSATNDRLEEIFSEIGPIKQCFVVREKGDEKCRGFGFVTFSMEEDAQRALKEIKDYDGKKLSLTVAKKKVKDKKKTVKETPAASRENEQKPKGIRKQLLKSRLIIRNLSFKSTEDDLKDVFGKFGTVLEAKIPLKPDGKMRGFAFVLFKTMSGAAKALEAMNLKEIKGRQVAVDWAVPKDKYVASQQPSSSDNNTKEEDVNTESDSEDANEKKTQAASENKRVGLKAAVQQVEESQSSDEDNDEERDCEEADSDDEEDEEEEDGGSGLDSDDPDDSQDEDEDDSQDEEEDEEEDQSALKKKSKKPLPSDVKEGRTIFIRNLSFDTDEEGLEEVLLQYGELNYIKIVFHPDTEHSKGCAFAQFKTKAAADKCVAAAQDEAEKGGIRVDGRKLVIVAAVSREDAVKLKVKKTKVETGSRNLYLAREGLIRAGTKAAEGVSETDMVKRARFEELKRAKLRDINVFVSKNRLCIHNLPKSVDNKKLKALCLQAVKGVRGVRVTECRVMYDKKPEKGQVMGQSLGYGFVQFQDHEQALACLRYLNNNPNIFSPQKRPIVEFSLEDSRKLKIKEMRRQKNKDFFQNQSLKGAQKPWSKTSGDGKGPKKGGNKSQTLPQLTGKRGSNSMKQKQDGHYSGFVTNPEVEHIDLQNGKKRRKVLPLPTHRGPKIRMRDKGTQQAPPPRKAMLGSKRKEHQRRQIERPMLSRKQSVKTTKKQFSRRDGDRFDSLVEQYKKKLMGSGSSAAIKRNKWFDT
ncbi:RNA-binding protein 28 [Xenentodon cancila]